MRERRGIEGRTAFQVIPSGGLKFPSIPRPAPTLVFVRFQAVRQPDFFAKQRQNDPGRLHLTCFQQQFQGSEVGFKLLFNLLADQSLRQLEKAADFSLATNVQLRAVVL